PRRSPQSLATILCARPVVPTLSAPQAPLARCRPTRRALPAGAAGPLPRTLALMSDASPTPVAPADPHGTEIRLRHRNPLGNLLRGALIGAVETIPGGSGGTVALVAGLYEELIDSAHHLTAAARRLVTGPQRRQGTLEHLRVVSWILLIPLMIGMTATVFTVAGPVSRLVESSPETMRALFFGLVLGSVMVPVKLSGGAWRLPEALRFALGALAGFAVTSLPTASLEPSPW